MRAALILAGLLATGTAQACDDSVMNATIGSVHLFQNPKSVTHHNGVNPGLGIECGNWQAGAFYNSIRRASVYVGRAVPGTHYFGLKYGLATGYLQPVTPYVAGYIRAGHWELTVIPKTEYNPLVLAVSVRW